MSRRRFYRPRIECLERRDTPSSNFAVSFTSATGTLSIVGNGQLDDITVEGNLSDATQFNLSSPGMDRFNGNSTYASPTGVKNITMTLLGNNTVLFDDAVTPIYLEGSLTIAGGAGASSVQTTDMSVAKNVTITNIGGGDTTSIVRDAAGYSFIGGNLSITSGPGADDVTHLYDTNVGGNVTVNDAKGSGAGDATTWISNVYNTTRSLIQGSVIVTYPNGSGHDASIWDTEVKGSVTFNNGGGAMTSQFDGQTTDLPVLILGNLTMTNSGNANVTIGTEYMGTGMIVGGNFTMTTPATTPPTSPFDTLDFDHLQVGGAATIGLGVGNGVEIDNSLVAGALSISNRLGANNVTATDLEVGRNLSITNGIETNLTDLTVLGSVLISNGNSSNTGTEIQRDAVGFNTILGNLSITNGTGVAANNILDTNIGGNVTINSGKGTEAYAQFYNAYNTVQSVIGGSVSVSFLTGTDNNELMEDTDVLGNVTFSNGSGSTTAAFDGDMTSLPATIHGNLTISGSGANMIQVGMQNAHTGLLVGKNFTFTSTATTPASSPADTLSFLNLQVNGNSKFTLSNGGDTVSIDDSVFHGSFTLTTGTGTNAVNLETTAGTAGPSFYEGPVVINLGTSDTTVTLTGNADSNQELIIYGTFIIHHGTGSSTDHDFGNEIFPFGTSIDWTV